ncbi:MAG: DsbA family protein [Deltaproteobacteria bacterium]|nr:DsbA family protein [Deltaproteobacteria bacterium]MBW2396270.1 DsbA family protein [Deltaproteobacteria bacterium]
MPRIQITHFSDALCVWAYVSQARYEELHESFPGQISMDYRFLSVFGDVKGKLARQWSARGGLEGYAALVQEVGAKFEHVELHPRVWLEATPASSMPAHLYLCAVRLLEARGELEDGALAGAARSLRQAFFEEAADIGGQAALLGQAERAGLARAPIEVLLDNGEACAALAGDIELAQTSGVRVSPTLSLNEDRQRLAGNVGYRVIEANVRELLERPAPEGSWC